MTDDTQPPLFDPSDLPPDPLPTAGSQVCSVYVASTLTRLLADPVHARMVEAELDTVTQAIKDLGLDGGLTTTIEPYAPIEHSSAHRHHDLTAEQVFRQNCMQLLTRGDALIVHGWEPGAGVGQEFCWAATQAGLPVLWLQTQGQQVSRQILGTPGDITFEKFDRPQELRAIVTRWLRSRRAVIEAGPHRRATRELRWRGPATAARARWGSLDPSERTRIAATGHVPPPVIEFYLSDPLLLALAPAWLLDVLTVEGLLLATSAGVRGRGQLATRQMLGLAEAAFEHGWPVDLVDHLRLSAEQLLAEPATRRLRLETPGDWARFFKDLRG